MENLLNLENIANSEIFEYHNTKENLTMIRFSDEWKEMREKRRIGK